MLDPSHVTHELGRSMDFDSLGCERLAVAFPLNIYYISSCSRVTRVDHLCLDLVSLWFFLLWCEINL